MVTAFVFRYSLRASCPVGVTETLTVSMNVNQHRLEDFVQILQQEKKDRSHELMIVDFNSSSLNDKFEMKVTQDNVTLLNRLY